jgi:hypothetical protein
VRRALAAAPIAAFVFVVTLIVVAIAVQAGVIGDDGLRLWAGASTAADGQLPIGKIVAAYPTLPFVTSTLLAWLAPAGTPAPALVAAALLALIAAFCFHGFRTAGFSAVGAVVAALLIAFHPALIRAAITGPSDMFLAAFLLMLSIALYNLRARSGTAEVMAVGLALMALAFSHPMGAALAFAAVLFLAFAVRPMLVANSALNIVIALIFPTVFAIGAFTYVSWVFPGNGWSFFAAPAQSLSIWSVAETRLFGDWLGKLLPLDGSLAMAAALLIGAPVAVVMLAVVYRRRPLMTPALVLFGAVISATALSIVSGFFGDPAALVVAAPILAATVLMRVPVVRERRVMAIALLLLGWSGGVASVDLVDPAMVNQLRAAVGPGGTARIDALTAGGAARRRDGVLADVDNAPAFVLGRGGASGILGPATEPFALALLFDRIDAPFVAVPDPQSDAGAGDRLNKAFPTLFSEGLAGYRLIYQNNTWRVFGRTKDIADYKD